jgi:hypothetical protein
LPASISVLMLDLNDFSDLPFLSGIILSLRNLRSRP